MKMTSPSPPRLCALRRRALSTKSWRMARAAMRLKWRREAQAIAGCLASFSHASFTNAVGLRVMPGSPRLTLEARRSLSSIGVIDGIFARAFAGMLGGRFFRRGIECDPLKRRGARRMSKRHDGFSLPFAQCEMKPRASGEGARRQRGFPMRKSLALGEEYVQLFPSSPNRPKEP